jgi:hypothetical protein
MMNDAQLNQFLRHVKVGNPAPSYAGLSTSCHEWIGAKTKYGYGVFGMTGNRRASHRVAYEHKHGPTSLMVLHKCDNRACVNVDHLFVGTHQDNMADMFAKGRNKCTEGARKHAKLTESSVSEIRQLYASGKWSQRQLAARFLVSQRAIGFVVRNELWKTPRREERQNN